MQCLNTVIILKMLICLIQDGFAPPEDDEIDEQAHLDQDEFWASSSSTSSWPFTISSPHLFEWLPSIARC